jgi:murein L,D-transpeptidase YcbB/YkuD
LADPGGGGLHPSAEEQKALAQIYPASSESPIWVDSTGHPTRSAQEALSAFVDAAAEGLDPADYRAQELRARRTNLDAVSRPDPREVAVFDVEVSLSIMRYLRHFHRGRVNPRDLGLLMTLPVDEHDYAGLARDAALKGRVRETIASMTPPLVQYRSLRSVLPRYRALALIDAPALPRAPARSVKPGDTAPGLDILRNRLIALQDLPETTAPLADPPRYEGDLVEGVRRFQTRHGLENDGVLGKATWAALNVPFRWRVRQIEMAMERLRWLPHLGERPFIAVNIPMFRLWGWDRVPETGAPDFGMGVIVGKAALDTKTPVFLGEMKYLTLRPYWNVPKSILQKEILPLLRRNLGYLERQDMEMVDGPGDDARRVAPTSENVDRLAQGELRLRQRPGTKNALGPIAFIFPNDMNVYLHGTPAPELFDRTRRDFSHGCVRVEDPLALAQWALKDRPEWTREKILAALRGTQTLRVPLTRPIRVVMYYVTAAVMPEDNSVRFAEDIYGHDSRLARALAARRRAS